MFSSGAIAAGSTATTQTAGDNSTKLATTAYTVTAVTTETTRATAAEAANTTAIATKLPLSGGTMTGALSTPTLTGVEPIGTGAADSGGNYDTSGTYQGAYQQNNPYFMRSYKNKAAQIWLNKAGGSYANTCGPTGTSACNPVQINMAIAGDSTTLYGSGSIVCTAAADEGGFEGAIGQGIQGLHYYNNALCGVSVISISYTGSAAATTTDYTHFPGGNGSNIPAGSCAVGTWTAGGATRSLVAYDVEPGAGTLTISTGISTSGPWTAQATINASAGSLAGAVWDVTGTGVVSAYAIASNVVTLTTSSTLIPSLTNKLTLAGFTGGNTFLNGTTVTVTSANSTTIVGTWSTTHSDVTTTTTSGTYALASNSTYIQACASGAGPVNVVAFGGINTLANGVVVTAIGSKAGLSLADLATTSSAITQPIWNDIQPDVVLIHMMDNAEGGAQLAYPDCRYSNTAAPTVYQPYGYWLNLWVTPFITANSIVDLALSSTEQSYDNLTIPNTTTHQCITVQNNALRTYAQQNEGVYLDRQYEANTPQSIAMNCNVTPHANNNCDLLFSQEEIHELGIDDLSLYAPTSQNVANANTSSLAVDVYFVGMGIGAYGNSPTMHTFGVDTTGNTYTYLKKGHFIYDKTGANLYYEVAVAGQNGNIAIGPGGYGYSGYTPFTLADTREINAEYTYSGVYSGFGGKYFNFKSFTPASSTSSVAYQTGGPTPAAMDFTCDTAFCYLWTGSAWESIALTAFQSGATPGLSIPNGTPTYTAGTNVTSVACASGFTCTNTRGKLTVVGGTATTGTIATINFSATLGAAPGLCTVTQEGGVTLFGIDSGVPSTTAFVITAAVSVAASTGTVSYSCQL